MALASSADEVVDLDECEPKGHDLTAVRKAIVSSMHGESIRLINTKALAVELPTLCLSRQLADLAMIQPRNRGCFCSGALRPGSLSARVSIIHIRHTSLGQFAHWQKL